MSENQTPGTVRFLFTDVEGSTRRWDEQPEMMKQALARHDELLRESIAAHEGTIFTTAGDAFCAAFASPKGALDAAIRAQQSLQDEDWGDLGQVAVRMSLHTGNADERDGDYFGPPLNRCTRLLATAHGGQSWCRSPPSGCCTIRSARASRCTTSGHMYSRIWCGPKHLSGDASGSPV